MAGRDEKFGNRIREALKLQAANMTQKQIIDNLTAKIVGVLAEVERADLTRPTNMRGAMAKIGEIVRMNRSQILTLRTGATFTTFPDAQIQAIIDKAVDDVAAALLEDR